MANTGYQQFKILNGASLSGAIGCEGRDVVAIITPGTVAGTQFTFQASADNATWSNVYDDAGNELTITMAASRYVSLGTVAKLLRAVRFLKVRTGTAGTPSNQSADRVFYLVTGEGF